jgi:cytoplasmic iron level regulating protein YaaA (DUF328/UPF0246 family)
MKILLSPAKSLYYSSNPDSEYFSLPIFSPQTNKLVKKMQKISATQLAKLMHISKELAQVNYTRYQDFQLDSSPTLNCQPAAFVFSGEVYRGLDFQTLNREEQLYAQEKLRILSGLYGILKPFDLIYPYRLEMATKMTIGTKIKNLYAYWEKDLNTHLSNEMQINEVLVNLASNEYFKVISNKIVQQKIITPIFKERKGEQYKIVMTYAKHARGAMARNIVQNQINDVDALKNYQVDGYRYHESLSNETEWVFAR